MNTAFWLRLFSNKTFLFAFAVIVAGIVIFHRLDESYLGGDDTYYSQVAKEMAVSGDYLTPHTRSQIDFHTSKPPLLFWMNALSGKAFGFTSAAMKLPSAVLCFLGVAALFFFVSRYFDPFTGFIAALVLTFTQQYMYHARSAVTDGPFAVFFMLSLFAFWAGRAEKKNAFFYLSGFFIGCAVMTRQIPGLFIFPVILAYIVLSKEFGLLKNPHVYGGALVSAAVFLPWHLAMYRMHGQMFLDKYFGVALMTGIKGYPADYSSSPSLNPWYAYAKILWENYWPWFPFLLAGIYRSIKKYKTFDPEYRKLILYVLLWFFVPLAIFQAAKVKQYHYIVPLYAACAIITATVFRGFKETVRIKAAAALTVLVTALTLTYLIYPVIPKTLDSREFNDTMQMMPEVKAVPGVIYGVRKGFSHYANCFLFYADKQMTQLTDDEFTRDVNTGSPATFVIFKEKYDSLKPSLDPKRVVLIKETKDSLLFRNR